MTLWTIYDHPSDYPTKWVLGTHDVPGGPRLRLETAATLKKSERELRRSGSKCGACRTTIRRSTRCGSDGRTDQAGACRGAAADQRSDHDLKLDQLFELAMDGEDEPTALLVRQSAPERH